MNLELEKERKTAQVNNGIMGKREILTTVQKCKWYTRSEINWRLTQNSSYCLITVALWSLKDWFISMSTGCKESIEQNAMVGNFKQWI